MAACLYKVTYNNAKVNSYMRSSREMRISFPKTENKEQSNNSTIEQNNE